jgi:membrane protein DedA with SNARE-associated domain
MLFAGELVLLPAIYLAVTGRLDLAAVVALSAVATTVSDLAWYYAGRRFPASALRRLAGRRRGRIALELEKLFKRKGVLILFLSKFVYGTRIAAQVLCGLHRMPFRTYIIANALGVLTLTATLVVIAYSVVSTTRRLADVVDELELAFLLFIVIVGLGHFVVGRVLRRRWSQ